MMRKPDYKVIENLPFREYLEIDAVSATLLKNINKSPAYADWFTKNEKESPALLIGQAVHALILEPDLFGNKYVYYDGIKRGSKWEDFRRAHTGKTIMSKTEYGTTVLVGNSIRRHKIAQKYLSNKEAKKELTVLWTHSRTGTKCKCRFDLISSNVLLDVKIMANIEQQGFANAFHKFGYDIQLAFYSDAAYVAGFGILPVKVVASQNAAPYQTAVYGITEEHWLNDGRIKYETAIDTYLDCKAKDVWPGIADNEEIELIKPAYLDKEESIELTMNGITV